MINVFFRYDDYCQLSEARVDHGVLTAFGRAQVPYTIAAIPAVTKAYPRETGQDEDLPLTDERAQTLRKAVLDGIVDVALHGWNHRPNKFNPPPNPSEFAGLSVTEQVEILRRGRDHLARATGTLPTVFVPPWNTYDKNTLTALQQLGFSCISANRQAPPPSPPTSLQLIPMTIELTGIQEAIAQARNSKQKDCTIGVMMHPYDFKESNDPRASLTLDEFAQLLSWLTAQEDVAIHTISSIAKKGEMDAKRFYANRPSFLEKVYPSFVDKTSNDPVFWRKNFATIRRCRRDASALIFFTGLLILTIAASRAASLLLPLSAKPAITVTGHVTAIAFIGLAARAVTNKVIYTRGVLFLVVLAGLWIGLAR